MDPIFFLNLCHPNLLVQLVNIRFQIHCLLKVIVISPTQVDNVRGLNLTFELLLEGRGGGESLSSREPDWNVVVRRLVLLGLNLGL